MIRNKKVCEKCQRKISLSNFYRHDSSCKGIIKKKVRGVDFDPAWGYAAGTRKAWNLGLTKETDDAIKSQAESMKKKFHEGDISPNSCLLKKWRYSEKGKKAASLGGTRGGGYRENAGKSKKFKCKDSFGKDVCLQSTYELELANILNEQRITWTRPSHFLYDENKKYFPDFFVPTLNIYLDTKNDYLIKLDAKKIKKVKSQNKIDLRVVSKEDIKKCRVSFIDWLNCK